MHLYVYMCVNICVCVYIILYMCVCVPSKYNLLNSYNFAYMYVSRANHLAVDNQLVCS